jgi:hypothetical protein
MKKLTLAFTLLTSIALAGTALADRDHGRDLRTPIADRRIQEQPRPTFQHQQPRWDVLTTKRASARRGRVTIDVPRMNQLDQLRLIASERGLDIVSIELSYGRGRTEVVQPASDGLVTLDLGRGKLRSIAVRYVNRGAGRDATIKVLGKADAQVGMR